MVRILLFFGLITLAHCQWQSYIDEQLVGDGILQQAAILGNDGSVWATSTGFSLRLGEGAGLVSLFRNPADAFVTGITINGIKYLGIKADNRSIYGKKGAGGVVTVKTKQTILVGVYNEFTAPNNAAVVVEKLGDYLLDNEF